MGEETFQLLQDAKESIKLFGFDLLKDDEPWQFVITFRLPGETAPIKMLTEFEGLVQSPEEKWQAIFPRDKASFPEPVKKKDFNKKVLLKAREILEGEKFRCTTEQLASIDHDEVFLKVALQESQMLNSLAERVEARARVKPSAYAAVGEGCPTEDKDFEIRHRPHRNLHNDQPVDNSCPAYVIFRDSLKDKLEAFDEPNQLRIIRRHIGNYISIEKMQKADIDVAVSFFAVHQWRHLEELRRRGWNDFGWSMWRWPSDETSDFIVQYTGVQVAFLFHLINTFVRWLAGPALLSTVNFVLRRCPFMTKQKMRYCDSAYGLMLCIWTTMFLVRYIQLLNLKIFRWGVSRSEEIGPVRKEFDDQYRDSLLDPLQKFGHTLLCVLFIAQTILACQAITFVRENALRAPDDTPWNIPSAHVVKMCKYAITANIMIVDMVWTPLSSWMSKKENWRTEADVKHHMIVKLFAVKFIVYYYPFFYTILIQPNLKHACGDDTMEGCVEKLRSDLYFFFICMVATEGFAICKKLLVVYWTVCSEIKKHPGKTYSYIELQAKIPPYDEQEQIEDFMKLVISFGFIAMFGVTCPSMSILCFVVQFPLKRLLAYKVSYAHQRVVPRLEEGIGAWRPIMAFIAYMGVTCTCYIVIFVFHIEDLSLAMKLIFFILSERALMALKATLEAFMGSKTVAQLAAEEHNEKVLDKVLMNA